MSDRPFNKLWSGFADDGRALDGPSDPAAAEPTVPGATDAGEPQPPSAASTLVDEVGALRADLETAHTRLLAEVRALRDENARLTAENGRWQALVGEYKRILSGS